MSQKNIVCLGGGVGTSNLLRGLKHYTSEITVITSMADDGGSSGRLREAYDIMPPGDIVNCIASLIEDDQKELASLLLYRFPGESKENKAIDGHKLGNLIMLAEIQRTGDFYKAIAVTKRMFGVKANIYPATDERVDLIGITNDGRRVESETTLDLALYSEPHGLKEVTIAPQSPKVNKKVIESLENADIIISGPGDLYTNQLPVLIVPEIKEAVKTSHAKKVFIVNIANKPFETKDFTLDDFLRAFETHLGVNPFDIVIANNNLTLPIPEEYNYSYVPVLDEESTTRSSTIVYADLVNDAFPLYHDAEKLARCLADHI